MLVARSIFWRVSECTESQEQQGRGGTVRARGRGRAKVAGRAAGRGGGQHGDAGPSGGQPAAVPQEEQPADEQQPGMHPTLDALPFATASGRVVDAAAAAGGLWWSMVYKCMDKWDARLPGLLLSGIFDVFGSRQQGEFPRDFLDALALWQHINPEAAAHAEQDMSTAHFVADYLTAGYDAEDVLDQALHKVASVQRPDMAEDWLAFDNACKRAWTALQEAAAAVSACLAAVKEELDVEDQF